MDIEMESIEFTVADAIKVMERLAAVSLMEPYCSKMQRLEAAIALACGVSPDKMLILDKGIKGLDPCLLSHPIGVEAEKMIWDLNKQFQKDNGRRKKKSRTF